MVVNIFTRVKQRISLGVFEYGGGASIFYFDSKMEGGQVFFFKKIVGGGQKSLCQRNTTRLTFLVSLICSSL